jgi:hypothetical protein
MVARIRSGRSIKGAINYNEKKVSEGKAELIAAINYPKASHRLNFHEKLNRLQNLANLNTRTGTNCLHLSLNFDPKENLSNEKLIQIAEAYMQGINFKDQPYLVYRHHDAAHQHIHIVSTNIKKDGTRISLHNLGRAESEKTRKEIEIKFGLIKADRKQQNKLQQLTPVKLEKALYGKVETKRAITNVVNQVISQYKFSSLFQFDAILRQYKVTADRGEQGSRMYSNRGLQYQLLDSQHDKIGVPIKASSIFGKPTLGLIESKFEENKKTKFLFQSQVRETIRRALTVSKNKDAFAFLLKERSVDVVFRTNDQNFIYGITYIDHNTKTVFNGSELGKEFSAAALRAVWEKGEPVKKPGESNSPAEIKYQKLTVTDESEKSNDVLDVLLQARNTFDYVLPALKRKRKKKKRKGL